MVKKNKTAKKKAKKSNTPKKKKSFILSTLKWGLVMGIWGTLLLIGIIAYYCYDLPDIARAAEFNRKRSITVYAADGETVIGRYGELLGENVTYEELPPSIIHAVLATEDKRFFYHFGIDPIGIFRAAVTNFQSNRIAQGGSTITQQLAKNMFLSSERTIKRKIQEAILSIWLESKFSKKEILSSYLNRVYMGAGAYGVDAASQIYFKKNVSDLTREESAILAGLLKAPSRYNPRSNPKEARERMQVVLKLMKDNPPLGIDLSDEQTNTSSARMAKNNVIIPPSKPYNISHRFDETRYFTDWVIEQVPNYVNSPEADLKIVTTLDLEQQKKAKQIALKYTNAYAEGTKKVDTPPEFSAILANKNGAIIALLGGSDYNKSQFNRATQAMRQPGSAFKPFVFLAALQQGRNMNDYISDDEFEKNGYAPTNYNGTFHGEVPLWEALMNSYNVATVRLLDETGIAKVLNVAKDLGISSKIQPDLSIALGSSETTLLEMVQAYHNIAQFRQKDTKLYAIQSIQMKDGKTLYERTKSRNRKNIDFQSENKHSHQMEQLTAMLQAVVQYGTGQRADLGFPVAGKTGTSQNNRDAWFIGFTSEYTAGVWVGNDNNKSMPEMYGGTIPASIWKDIVLSAHQGRKGKNILSRAHKFEYDSDYNSSGFFSRNDNHYGRNNQGRHFIRTDRLGRAYTDRLPQYSNDNSADTESNYQPNIEFLERGEKRQRKSQNRLGNNPNALR
jgi:penicillin-binding protein 1A